jgi:formate hydrogenlyase subunit 4
MNEYLSNREMQIVYIILLTVFVGPIVGGLITGIDRKITARLQGRFGPPILQPFYDFFKLIGKERFTVNSTQMIYVIGMLFFAITALIMFTLGMDMLMMVFVLAFSNISLIMGAMSVRSPFSKIGSQREIIQMMAYEPVILLMVLGIYKITGSFMILVPFTSHVRPLIADLPLLFFAFSYILTIKLRKSPFDYSTSHHGHQELIKGLTMEFSGLQLAMIEIAHWYEVVLLMGLVVMFWAQPIWAGILLAIVIYLIEIIIDNICARTTWKWMLKMTSIVGLGTALTNMAWLYLAK